MYSLIPVVCAQDITALVRALPGSVAQGLIWGIMAIGVFLTFKILDFADLTVDGTMATGGVVTVMLILKGWNPVAAVAVAFVAGMLAGLITGILHTVLGIPDILAGILTQLSLYSINLNISEGKANQAVNVDMYKLVEGLDNEVKDAILNAAKVLEEKGAIVEEFDLSLVEYAIPAYYVIACAEASSNLARFDGVKYGYRTEEYDGLHNMYKKSRSEGFGAEVKRRIMLGSFVLSSGYYDAYYLKALRTKALIKKAFDEAFAKYDVILGPAAPTTAPKLGESLSDPLKMYLGDIYTISVNLAGLPGITVPCGTDSKGLPIGLQLIGDCFKEKNIIRAAYSFEQTRDFKHSPLAE